ncbi:MAG TPA: ATP-binding protein [Candidatus Thermoplasmatota archaeon]|nr:ATP-binding protein [Candidatus Thermoplasmatota archaeon]
MKDIFKTILQEFHERSLPELVSRNYQLPDNDQIQTLIGLRRVGKTFLLYQKIKELTLRGIPKETILFINYEDERLLNLKAEDLHLLLEAYFELYPENVSKKLYLFFDEIQAAPSWHLFIKRLYEQKNLRIYITGSSSKLLSSELATQLRGRTQAHSIYPLSFSEFLKFKQFEPGKNITYSRQRFPLKKLFTEYLEYGGYPDVTQRDNLLEKEAMLRNYLDLIIYKDIADRYKIRNTLLLKNLMKYIVTNTAKHLSLNAFYESMKQDSLVSKDTVWEYFSYLEEIGFVYQITKYSPSLKKQYNAPKKTYIADNGFKKIYGMNFSEDAGRILENMVFLELKRQQKELFYFKDKYECDFIIKEGKRITNAYQICYHLNRENTERELHGLNQAMATLRIKNGAILTFDQEKKLTIEEKTIPVIPVWKWLLV